MTERPLTSDEVFIVRRALRLIPRLEHLVQTMTDITASLDAVAARLATIAGTLGNDVTTIVGRLNDALAKAASGTSQGDAALQASVQADVAKLAAVGDTLTALSAQLEAAGANPDPATVAAVGTTAVSPETGQPIAPPQNPTPVPNAPSVASPTPTPPKSAA